LPLALGPHPQRELTLTPSRGVPCPRLGVAAGALPLALGPHPQRELTLTLRRGLCWRRHVAAGAPQQPHQLLLPVPPLLPLQPHSTHPTYGTRPTQHDIACRA